MLAVEAVSEAERLYSPCSQTWMRWRLGAAVWSLNYVVERLILQDQRIYGSGRNEMNEIQNVFRHIPDVFGDEQSGIDPSWKGWGRLVGQLLLIAMLGWRGMQ